MLPFDLILLVYHEVLVIFVKIPILYGSPGIQIAHPVCYSKKDSLQLNNLTLKVKGAAPLGNLSIWKPRFGGLTWG